MNLKQDYMITALGEEYVVVPIGVAAERLHGIIRINETGKAIWDVLSDGMDESSAAKKLTEIYDVDTTIALQSVRTFTEKLRETGIIVDN